MPSYVNTRWKGLGIPTVHMLQRGVFIFYFDDPDEKNIVLERNRSYLGNPLILKPWSPQIDLQNLDVEKVLVWVQFLGLPLSFWTPQILGKIASYLGKPLATDKLTGRRDRLAFARVLIDIKVTDELEYDVPVTEEEVNFLQEVVYEWLLVRCS